MTRTIQIASFLAFAASGEAFSLGQQKQTLWIPTRPSQTGIGMSSIEHTSSESPDTTYYIDIVESNTSSESSEETEIVAQHEENIVESTMKASSGIQQITKKNDARKAKNKGGGHKEGVFSPVVRLGKSFLGEQKLKGIRGKVISMHSGVIKDFVATSDTSFGQTALKTLFSMADKNGDGSLDKEEITEALNKLGFEWFEEKEIEGILKRADKDKNGTIELEEFEKEVPKTLKTNLVKLAKKNGDEMGLLV